MSRLTPIVFVALDGIEEPKGSTELVKILEGLLRVPGVTPETVGFKFSQSAFLAAGIASVPLFLDAIGMPADYQIFLDTKFASEERELIRALQVVQRVYPSAYVNIWARHLQPSRFASQEFVELIRDLNVLSLITSSFTGENDHADALLQSRIDTACELGCSGVIIPGHCPQWVFKYPKGNHPNSNACQVWATGIRSPWYTINGVHMSPVSPSMAIKKGADRIIVGTQIMRPLMPPYRETAMKSLGQVLAEVQEAFTST